MHNHMNDKQQLNGTDIDGSGLEKKLMSALRYGGATNEKLQYII